MEALVQFYYQTGGPTDWRRDDNWLIGEPCENSWYGVVCCPVGFTALGSDGLCRAEGALNGESKLPFNLNSGALNATVTGGLGSEVAPLGCRSGVSFGAAGGDADRTRCRVVRIELPSNNLVGTLALRNATDPDPDSTLPINVLCPMLELQFLILPNNSLRGPLPDDIVPATNETDGLSALPLPQAACLPRLRHLDLEDNELSGDLPLFIRSRQIEVAKLGSAQVTAVLNHHPGKSTGLPPNLPPCAAPGAP